MNSHMIQPGDVINTTGHAPLGFKWSLISKWVVTQGIHAYQRWLRGYPHPAWTRTHTRLVLRDGLCLSVTDPVTVIESVDDVLAQYPPENIAIMRPKFYDYTQGDGVAYLEDAAVELIGRRYDRGQLVDIFLNKLLGIPDNQFTRVFDAGTMRTVCSGGVAACYEYHRRVTGKQWPRLFGSMFVERVPPAAFEALPRGADWDMEFAAVQQLELKVVVDGLSAGFKSIQAMKKEAEALGILFDAAVPGEGREAVEDE